MVRPAHELSRLLLAAALAGAPRSQAAPTEGAVSRPTAAAAWRGPAEVGPNASGRIELHLRVPSGKTPRVATSAGRLSPPERRGEGSYVVWYTRPEAKHPQVALLVASDEHGSWVAQHRIDLLGAASVDVLSEPEVLVNVHVGDRVFGPIRTDRKGQGKVRVVVPPGARLAQAHGTDTHGNTTVRNIPLRAPGFVRHLLLCPVTSGHLFVLATTERGTASEKADFVLQSDGASLGEPTALEPGLFAASLQPLATGGQPGSEPLVELVDESGAPLGHCTATVAAEQTPVERPAAPADGAGTHYAAWSGVVRAGYTTNFTKVAGPLVGARLEHHFPLGAGTLSVGLDLAALHSTKVEEVNEETVDLTVDAVPISLRAGYSRQLGAVRVAAGVGGGALLAHVLADSASARTAARDAVALLGGWGTFGYGAGSSALQLELGYWSADFDSEGIHGAIPGFSATLGYVWRPSR